MAAARQKEIKERATVVATMILAVCCRSAGEERSAIPGLILRPSVPRSYDFIRRRLRRRRLPVAHFLDYVRHHLVGPGGTELLLHAAQRDTHDISMVQLGARISLAQFQPKAMDQVDVFGPQARR